MINLGYIIVFLFVSSGRSTTLASTIQQSQADIINKDGDVQSIADEPCESPSPDSIYPCRCSYSQWGSRSLDCKFDFASDANVTELTHNIFSQFNDSNNKFDYAKIQFYDDYANFVFDENTTGKLVMEDLNVPFRDNQIEGSKLFYKSAFKNSKATLASITVNFEDVFSITNAWNFGPGTLDDLSNLTHLRLEHYDFKVESFSPSVLSSLQELSLGGYSTDLSNFSMATLPNLVKLRLNLLPGPTLPEKMLYNLPGLETFSNWMSDTEIIPDNFFARSTSCTYVELRAQIHTIDLSGLNPNANIRLLFNQISQLPEKNFRPFVESVLNTPNATGEINLYGNQLECSCDIKWLVVDLREGLRVFTPWKAECADGRALHEVDPEALEIECPDN